MKKMKLLRYLSLLFFCSGTVYSQIQPTIDPNWVLNTTLSDEFEKLDLNKWHVMNANDISFGGLDRWRPDNVSIENGELWLRADGPFNNATLPYDITECCNTGGIRTNQENYHYGYYEISAKLPGNYHNGEPNGQKFWPTFWTAHIEVDSNNCRVIHDELDILEPSGTNYSDASSNVVGWHDEHPDCNIDHVKVSGSVWYTHNEPLFENYHRYAVEWLPDRIIFYFDDTPFYASFNHPKMVMDPQWVFLDLQIDGKTGILDFNPSVTFPQFMKVKYFRYYELNDNYCGINSTILNNSQFNNFITGVRNNINIGNGSTNIFMSNNDVKTFRAKNEITINGNFTVPLGCELNLIPTPCD